MKNLAKLIRASVLLALCTTALVVLTTTETAHAATHVTKKCSLGTLKGTYVQAYPGVQDGIHYAFAGNMIYDGHGHLRGFASLSLNGRIFSHVPYIGTYTLKKDCTGTMTATAKGHTELSGTTQHFDLFPTTDGNTIAFVRTDPGTRAAGFCMRGTDQRVKH